MRGRQRKVHSLNWQKGKRSADMLILFIDKEILEQSFPALKELLVFSYGFTF